MIQREHMAVFQMDYDHFKLKSIADLSSRLKLVFIFLVSQMDRSSSLMGTKYFLNTFLPLGLKNS